MKIISFNVRGLGRGIKWGSIRRMVIKETVGMLCLQETKKEAIDKALCQALWGYSEVKWELNPTINSPGGMLCLWSEATFKMENKITGSGFIFLQGIWHGYGERVVILNIYSPCDVNMKRILWDQIKQLRRASNVGHWCILGDFNSIRRPSERVGVSQREQGEGGIVKDF